MSRETPEGRLLTKFEGLLDTHHKALPLWSQPRPEAVFATLAAFDLTMLPIAIGAAGAGPNPYAMQKVKGYHDSLIYAMRFFWEESKNLRVRPTSETRLIDQAASYLLHCDRYGTLVDFH